MNHPLHTLRAGVIGTGFIGLVHIEALKRLGVRVIAICGSTRSARATADRWGIPDVYGDYDYRRDRRPGWQKAGVERENRK